LYLAVFGRFFSTGRFVFQQISPNHAIHVVESGQGVMRVGGIDYPVGPGDLFTFFPGDHVQYHDFPATPWRYSWFCLEGRRVAAVLAHAGITPGRPHVRGDWAGKLEPMFREIVVALDRPVVPPSCAAAWGWRLADALAGPQPAPGSSGGSGGPGGPAGIAAAAQFLMDHHFRDGITIEDLADRLGVHRSTLFRHFHAEYRVNPKSYLDALRLGLARKLLRQSDSGLKGIAAACGYNSLPHFVRCFHRATGRPPGAWRRGA